MKIHLLQFNGGIILKLKFDANLSYQDAAISSTIRLFEGQNQAHSEFTVSTYNRQANLADYKGKIGIGNLLPIKEEMLENLRQVQLENGLPQSKNELGTSPDFEIEMETGTGKTYVYLKTIYELKKRYGFSKFVIVVPSIPIKEGVMKSLEITSDHFANLYSNEPISYFMYDSSKLQKIWDFATSESIQVMIITIKSFIRELDDTDKSNVIYRPYDKMNGMKPIDLIRETNPIVIIDEPQSVDNTEKSQDAIKALNPLCKLRYSATHRTIHNLIYKLDAVDSYDLGLVKGIEVASSESKENANLPYFKLESVSNKNNKLTAKLTIDVLKNNDIKRKTVTVDNNKHSSIYEQSGNRDIYTDYTIEGISCTPGNEYVKLSKEPEIIRLGEEYGDIDDLDRKRHQINRTIREHLDKELRLNPLGIKVLSLFFIDKVEMYYGHNGHKGSGIYGQIFEEEYKRVLNSDLRYKSLKHFDVPVDDVHGGYFAIDKKGAVKDSKEEPNEADKAAFSLIMRDKENLLSFKTNLRFIFSHSALREGWDNPNVFQICTLAQSNNNLKKRQEIGRGLRLCVNQNGERLHDRDINILTVMANESYEEFAAKLQREYEDEGGIKFNILESHTFANILRVIDGVERPLGEQKSAELFNLFLSTSYIDKKGKIQTELKDALKNETLSLPDEFDDVKDKIIAICRKVAGSLNIRNADNKHLVKRNKAVYLSPEFKALWDKIKYKTTYSVEFDTDSLVQKCIIELKKLSIPKPKVIESKVKIKLNRSGVETEETARMATTITQDSIFIPDIVMYLQNKTGLTRKTITRILVDSQTLNDKFLINPQKYMVEASKIIMAEMQALLVEGIKYTKLGNDQYYTMELIFKDDVLTGYLKENLVSSKKSVYECVLCDSDVEKSFAEKFENNPYIKLYAKLPDSFVIPTPLGNYNPDWAVLIEKNGIERLYFVVETKGSTDTLNLRGREVGKIKCGREHFKALNTGVEYKLASKYEEFIDNI